MDSNRNVTVRLQMKADAADPFKKLSEKAANWQREMKGRIADVSKELAAVGTKRGQGKEIFENLIGATNTDDMVARLQNRIRDSLRRLRLQGEQIKLGADPGPALQALSRIRTQVDGLKRAAESAQMGTFGGLRRAGGGAFDATRGVAILSEGNQEMEKMVRTMLQFQAVSDIVRGVWDAFAGVAGATANLMRWNEAARAGQTLSSEFALTTDALNAAAATQTAEELAAAQALTTQAAVAERAAFANRDLASSHIEAARAAVVHGMVSGEISGGALLTMGGAARRGSQARLGYAGSAAAAAGHGGGRVGRALIGGTAGGVVGAYVGSQYDHTALGAIGGTALGVGLSQAAPWIGAKASAGYGALGGAATLGPVAGVAAAAAIALGSFVAHTDKGSAAMARLFMTVDKSREDVEAKMHEAEADAQTGGDDLTRAQLRQARLGRAMRGLGYGLPHMEDAARESLAITNPADDQRWHLRGLLGEVGTEITSGRQSVRRQLRDRGLNQSQERYDLAREMALRPDAGRGALGGLVSQGMGLIGLGTDKQFRGSDSTAAGLAHANQARAMAEARILDLQKQVVTTGAERLDLEQKMLAAKQALVEADRNALNAARAHSAAEVERLDRFRQFASENEKFFKARAQAERDSLTAAKQQFGLEDPIEQAKVLGVARAVAEKRPLSKEQLEIAKSHNDIFEGPLRKIGLDRADKGGFGEAIRLIEGAGFQTANKRAKEAEQAAEAFGAARIQLENRVQAEISLNEESLAQQLQEKVVPLIQQTMQQVEKVMAEQFKALQAQKTREYEQARAQQGGK